MLFSFLLARLFAVAVAVADVTVAVDATLNAVLVVDVIIVEIEPSEEELDIPSLPVTLAVAATSELALVATSLVV